MGKAKKVNLMAIVAPEPPKNKLSETAPKKPVVKGRLAKCPVCNELISRDCVTKKEKGKTYHIDCYDKMIVGKYGEIEQQVDHYSNLKLYIKQLFNVEEIPALIENQLVKYAKERGYTPSGMYNALYYFYELQEHQVEGTARGIGIIPFIYKEANDFFDKIKQQEEHIKTNGIGYEAKETTIKIKPKPYIEYFKLYDINEL